MAWARVALGQALVHRHTDAESDRGQTLLAEVGDGFLRRGFLLCDLPIVEVYVARERARRGDRNEALALMRAAVDHLFRGDFCRRGAPATGVLVEALLERGAESDVSEAQEAIDRLAAARPTRFGGARNLAAAAAALLARAHGDEAAYRDLGDRYRAMAESLGFEGHIAWAEAMIESGIVLGFDDYDRLRRRGIPPSIPRPRVVALTAGVFDASLRAAGWRQIKTTRVAVRSPSRVA